MTKKELIKKRVSAINLGCDKNKVDLEKMFGRILAYGFELVPSPEEADIVIVNTCAFITPAKLEALLEIMHACQLKTDGVVEKVIVTGCMPQLHKEALERDFPLVNEFVQLKDNDKICQIIEELYGVEKSKQNDKFDRILINSESYAYLKIADGCNNVCSFCTIPRIRGRYISAPMDELVAEAKSLASHGVKELILVAQDTTRYGEDLYGKNCLIELCEKLSKIKGIEWIRLHYAYPEKVDKKLLDFIASNPKMCKYIDIPLQHIDDKILKSMRRRVDEEGTRALIKLLHSYPEIKIRSTFIVGYPGETRKDFKKLCQFLKQENLDYAGFFPYYREENTVSYFLKNQKSNWTKKRRLNKIQKLQKSIMQQNAMLAKNQTFEVLVDYFDESSGYYSGHTNFQSPTVDFDVKFMDNNNVKVGDFVKVKIYDFDGSSFKGEIV